MSLTPQTFAEITTALARTLDPYQLAAAVGALAPLVAADTSACERARAKATRSGKSDAPPASP